MRGKPTIALAAMLLVAGCLTGQTLRSEDQPSSQTPDDSVTPRIELQASPQLADFGTVTVSGLSAEIMSTLERAPAGSSVWAKLFAVYTGPACPKPGRQYSVLGSYDVEEGAIRFRPRFPFVAGLFYCARFDPRALGTSLPAEKVETRFALPQPSESREPPTVEAIYPSSSVVPANLLRLYIHFSAPMRGKGIDERIHLFDAAGEEVLLPFVEIPQGLWDPSGTRLTLFFHPGRIKRGVGPNLSMGTPLRQARRYRLVVGAGMQNLEGVALGDDFEHEFVVGAEDRESPDPSRWLIEAPTGATAALVVGFPDSLDRALLHRMLRVVDPHGDVLDGTITVEDEETRWVFQPSSPWVDGDYLIEVDSALEDLAGNAIGHLFEEVTDGREIADQGDASGPRGTSKIPFSVR